jgi:hypothetical protein
MKSIQLKDFVPFSIEHRDIVLPFIRNNPLCDYNFVNLLLWGGSYDLRFKIHEDLLFIYNFRDDFLYMPLGRQISLMDIVRFSDHFMSQGASGNLVLVPEQFVEANCGNNRFFKTELDHEDANYIYLTSATIALKGTRLRKKRNHISHFRAENPDYQVRVIVPDLFDDCHALIDKWAVSKQKSDDETRMFLAMENIALDMAFRFYEKLELSGLGIYIGDSLAGLSIYSSQTSDMASIHFEKYDPDIRASSPAITWETARHLEKRYKYLNREQDLALDGLRKAKRAWDPVDMVNTYLMFRKND